ncbi:helix-turn-helix transcriptional regulator [Diaminobutyricibacter sp. McL0608]|uniref:helix-turn-helix transcriptional regulator n=1 Tax=Leifsonia sp. McL0608 TaxID=3143537 RepID=UPI0031F30F06
MLQTSSRLLSLLSLLQSRPSWGGPELSERLGVGPRTVRNDIDRLRDLGYPIDATRGPAGGYRLGAGADLPPLLFDDDEAVAIAVGLTVTSSGSIEGIEESSRRALTKMEQVLPSRLRAQVTALRDATETVLRDTAGVEPEAPVPATVLAAIASAVRDAHWLRFDYAGEARLVEPYRLVNWNRRWYLAAWDLQGDRWSTFRVDSIRPKPPTYRPFTPRSFPEGGLVGFVQRDVAAAGWKVTARITVFAPADDVVARINPAVGVVEVVDENTSVLITGADMYETIALYIGLLGRDFQVTEPPELVAHLRALGERYARAVS